MTPLLIVQAPDLSQAIELAQALVETSGLVISVAADVPERVIIIPLAGTVEALESETE